jgi:hypothetical protein
MASDFVTSGPGGLTPSPWPCSTSGLHPVPQVDVGSGGMRRYLHCGVGVYAMRSLVTTTIRSPHLSLVVAYTHP